MKLASLDDVHEKNLLAARDGLHLSSCPSELRLPFSHAVAALREENEFLYKALSKQRDLNPMLRRGLAYWLFETTLVYLIFRRWIDEGYSVRWEERYPKSRRTADLVLSMDSVIEAKWWNRNTQATLDGISGDVQKLRSWKKARNRVVLAFWYSPRGHWERDRIAVKKGCVKMGLTERPLFVAAFPTHVPDPKRSSDYYFAVLGLDASR